MFNLNIVAGHNYCWGALWSCLCGRSSSMLSTAAQRRSLLSHLSGARSLLRVSWLTLSTGPLAYLDYCHTHPSHPRLQFENSFGFCFGTLVNLASSITFSSACKCSDFQPRLSRIDSCLQSAWLSWSAVGLVAWATSSASEQRYARYLAFGLRMLLAWAAPWWLRWGSLRLQSSWAEFVNYFFSANLDPCYLANLDPYYFSDCFWASCGIGNTPELSSDSGVLSNSFVEKELQYFLWSNHCLEEEESSGFCWWQSSHFGAEQDSSRSATSWAGEEGQEAHSDAADCCPNCQKRRHWHWCCSFDPSSWGCCSKSSNFELFVVC